MKGELSVDPTFRSLAIRKPTIYSRNPLVAFDGHRLHFQTVSIAWQHKNIINCAYSVNLGVAMVLCSDWKLYVYNRNLDLIARLSDWESKYSVGFEYVQELSMFILVGVIEVETLRVSLKTNLKETKFLSSVKFGIERKELRQVDEKNRLSWNKGYGYSIAEDLLWVWSTQNINFYSLSRLELKSAISKLVKKQQAITCVHLNRSYKYTLTGLINGSLRVWRLPLMQLNSSPEYIMIHNCLYHAKPIDRIIPASDDRIVISAAEDLTVCMWSLETFELLRVYNFEGQYSQLYLIDHRRAFAIQGGELGELTFGKTMQFILEIDSGITYFDKSFNSSNRVNSFQLTLESNVGFQIVGSSLRSKDLNKIEIAYFYPPLKAQSILQVICSPYEPTIYYMLVENGELFSLRIENNSSKIEESFSLQHTQDSENHSLNQTPTFLAFLPLPDLSYDSEITDNFTHRSSLSSEAGSEPAYKKLKLLTIGCNRGSIIVLSLDHIQKIRTRLTYHRQAITAIQSLYCAETGTHTLASMCRQDYLRFIHLEQDRAHCFLTIFCDGSLKFFRSFQNQLALVFKRGIFEVATVDGSQQIKLWQNLDSIDHEGEIFSLDYESNHNLIMTSGSDNRIKIWSKFKILIFQIKLDEGLRYTIWSNNLQIFVAHRNKLLYLREFQLPADQQEEPDIENDRRFNPILLRDFFSQFKRERPHHSNFPENFDYSLMPEPKSIRRKAKSQVQNKSVAYTTDLKQQQKEWKVKDRGSSITGKKKSSKKKVSLGYGGPRDEQQKKRLHAEANLKATKKHLQQISQMKRLTNQSLLPKIQPKVEDKFEQFINAKLISKKMLTRRDITLNRIIMKNLIKEQFSQEDEQISSLKLDF